MTTPASRPGRVTNTVLTLMVYRGVQVLAGFLLSMAITTFAGVEAFGRFSEIIAVIAVLTALGALSIGQFMIFELAGETGPGPVAGVNARAACSLALAGVLCAGAFLAYGAAAGVGTWALAGGAAIILAQPQILKYEGLLRARDLVREAYLFDQLMRPLLTLGLVTVLAVWATAPGSGPLVAATALGYLATAAAARLYAEHRTGAPLGVLPRREAWDRALFMRQLRFALPQVFGVISANIAVLASSVYATDTVSAQLRLIFQYASILFLVHMAVQAQAAPRIRICLREGETEALQALLDRLTRMSAAINLPVFIALMLGGARLIEALHGVEIPPTALAIFAAALYFETGFGPKAVVLMQSDNAPLVSWSLAAGLSAFLVVLLALDAAGGFGPVHAIVLAYAANITVMTLSIAILVRVRTGVRLWHWLRFRP